MLAALPALETLSFKKNRLAEIGEHVLPWSLRALILTNNELSQVCWGGRGCGCVGV